MAAQLGHKSRDYRTTDLYAAFNPAYLQNAVRAIDLLFKKASRQRVGDPAGDLPRTVSRSVAAL